MDKAALEISHWTEYDYVLVNDSLDATLEKIIDIVDIEREKRLRQNWLPSFVEGFGEGIALYSFKATAN